MERARRWLVRSLATLGALMVFVTITPVVPWWGRLMSVGSGQAHGDVLVVLAGSILQSGIMGESSYWRSAYAVQAWREGGFRWVVISGGSDKETPISTLIAKFLEANGVPHEAIQVETESNTTRENALDLKPALAALPGTKVLLTSDYHMFRAYRTFRKAGVEVIPRPFRDVQMRGAGLRGRWSAFLDLIMETSKIVYYGLKGWL